MDEGLHKDPQNVEFSETVPILELQSELPSPFSSIYPLVTPA